MNNKMDVILEDVDTDSDEEELMGYQRTYHTESPRQVAPPFLELKNLPSPISTPNQPVVPIFHSTVNELSKDVIPIKPIDNLSSSVNRAHLTDILNEQIQSDELWNIKQKLWKHLIDKNHKLDEKTIRILKNYEKKCKTFNELKEYYNSKYPGSFGGKRIKNLIKKTRKTNKKSKKMNKKSRKTQSRK
jgi:hypothetical protein